jgi:hypothetical protein
MLPPNTGQAGRLCRTERISSRIAKWHQEHEGRFLDGAFGGYSPTAQRVRCGTDVLYSTFLATWNGIFGHRRRVLSAVSSGNFERRESSFDKNLSEPAHHALEQRYEKENNNSYGVGHVENIAALGAAVNMLASSLSDF